MLTINHNTVFAKSGADTLTTSYTAGNAINVKGAVAIKLRVYSARGAANTGNLVQLRDTSPADNVTLGAQSFAIRTTLESTGTTDVAHTFTTDGVADVILCNLGGAFESVTVYGKAAVGALDAGDILIVEATTVEE